MVKDWVNYFKCNRCGFTEHEGDETILTCKCKKRDYGNMDEAFTKAIKQAELLRENGLSEICHRGVGGDNAKDTNA